MNTKDKSHPLYGMSEHEISKLALGTALAISSVHEICDKLDISNIRAVALSHEFIRSEAVLSELGEWTHTFGKELTPNGPNTYGEGVRTCKRQVAVMLNKVSKS